MTNLSLTDRFNESQERRAAELQALDWTRVENSIGTIKLVSPSGRLAVWLYPTFNHYQEIRQ